MADEEDVVVTVEGAPNEGADETKTEVKPRGADGKFVAVEPAEDLAKQFRELQTQSDRDRQAKEAADRRAADSAREAQNARQEAASARTEAVESQYDTVTSGLAAAQAEASQAEHEYATAFEKGDPVAMAAAQRKVARAEARSERLEEAKADLETRKTKTADDATRRTDTARPAPVVDPVDAYIAGRTEPTANWLRSHKDWITDARKNAKLTAAHHDAVAEGIAVDTPDYFEHVESFIGLANGNGAAKPEPKPKPARRATVPVAPVQASGGGTNGGGTEVRLSQGEARAATDGTHTWNYDDTSPQKRFKKGDPIGVQEFARRKHEMTKQGLYDRSHVES